MDKQTEKLLVNAGLVAAAYLLVIKPVLAAVGVDPADTATVTDQQNTSPDENPFSPQFAPFLQNWTNSQPAGLSVADGMAQIKEMGDSGTLSAGSQAFNTYTWGEAIISALSVWNWRADTQAVISIFNQMATQTQVAALAAYLSFVHGKDLLTFLHYGGSAIPWVPNGLPESQVAQIVNQINNLPQ